MLGKLQTRWEGPYPVVQVYDYGVVELQGESGTFKVNVHRIKVYFGEKKVYFCQNKETTLFVDLKDAP